MTNLTYAPDEGAEVELVGIDGMPLFNADQTPMTVTVLGADSDTAVKSRNDNQDRRWKQAGRGVSLSAAVVEKEAVSYLAKLTTGWNLTPSKLVPGIDPGLGDGPVAFTQAAAISVFGNPKLAIIREQIDTAISERARFMRASPAT